MMNKFLAILALGLLSGAMNALAAPIGLIHHWTGDNTADDSIGAVDGSFAGAYEAGLNGAAFSFNGSNSTPLFTAAVDIGPNSYSEITFGAWVNLRSIANSRGWVFGHDNGGYDRALMLHDTRFNNGPSAGVGTSYPSSLAALTLNSWHFVAVSYAADNTATVYSDGAFQQVLNVNNNTGNSFFSVGGLTSHSNHQIDGLVDDVFIFDRALSVAELDSIRASGLVPEPSILALFGLGLAGLGFARRKRA